MLFRRPLYGVAIVVLLLGIGGISVYIAEKMHLFPGSSKTDAAIKDPSNAPRAVQRSAQSDYHALLQRLQKLSQDMQGLKDHAQQLANQRHTYEQELAELLAEQQRLTEAAAAAAAAAAANRPAPDSRGYASHSSCRNAFAADYQAWSTHKTFCAPSAAVPNYEERTDANAECRTNPALGATACRFRNMVMKDTQVITAPCEMNAAMDDLKNLDNSMAPFLVGLLASGSDGSVFCANEKQDPYVFVADKLAGAPEMQAVIQAVNLFHYDLRQSVIVLTHPEASVSSWQGFTRKVIRLTDLQKSTCFRRAVFPAYGYQSPFLQTLSGCSGEAKDLCEGYRNKIPERAHAPACPA